jgi:hypothetical protein
MSNKLNSKDCHFIKDNNAEVVKMMRIKTVHFINFKNFALT